MGDIPPTDSPHIGDILSPGNTTPKNTDLTNETIKLVEQEREGPRITKIKGSHAIALDEEAYYLDVCLGHEWQIKIDDMRTPKGPLRSHTMRFDKTEKIVTSQVCKPIRDAYKTLYGEDYNRHLNKTLLLLEENATYFELEEGDPREEEGPEENPGAILVRLARNNTLDFFHDQLKEGYVTYNIEISVTNDTNDTKNPFVTPTTAHIHTPTNDMDICVTPQSNNKESSVVSVTSVVVKRTVRIKSQEYKQKIARLYYNEQGKTAGGDALSSALLILESMALEGEKRVLYNRLAPDGMGGFYWDMSDRLGRAIHLTKDGWSIDTQPPQIFKHYPHQEPLPDPAEKGSLLPLLDYILLNEPGQALLSVVTPITYLVPDVAHVLELVHGTQGATKSSRHRFNRKIVDPSATPLIKLPKDPDQMVQHADHHYLLIYDNVTKIDEDQSDLLCKIVTGLGFSKRMLYTDDETVIRQIMRCVNINGINIPAERSDLLDRGVILTAGMFPDEKRKTDAEIKAKMEHDAPLVIRAMLDVMVSALNLYDGIKTTRNNRMADFTKWGCAITQAIGIEQAYFENAYHENINTQNEEAIKSNTVASWLVKWFDYENPKNGFSGSASDIMEAIIRYAQDQFNRDLNWVDGWPKGATPFGKELRRAIPNLKGIGYNVGYARSSKRSYQITKIFDANTDKATPGQRTLIKMPDEMELTTERLRTMLKNFEKRYDSPEKTNYTPILKQILENMTDLGQKASTVEMFTAWGEELEIQTQEEFDKIFSILQKDGTVYSPEPGYWEVSQ